MVKKMAIPVAEWKKDHVFIPAKLYEITYQGFIISMRIELEKPQGKPVIETTIRKEKPVEKVAPEKIAPMSLYPQEFLPEALEFLRQGYTLVVDVSLKEIRVTAEKRLSL